jgi:hypothetical protein
MQTIKASTILEDAERMLGWDLLQLETRQKQMARQALSMALQEVWESWWWETLMQCKAIAGAEVYSDSTTYAAGANVYFHGSQQFYQAMAATTGNPPATSSNGSWTTDYAHWADAKPEWTAADYEADDTLEVGTIRRYQGDGEYHQLIKYTLSAPAAEIYQKSGDLLVIIAFPEVNRATKYELYVQPTARFEVPDFSQATLVTTAVNYLDNFGASVPNPMVSVTDGKWPGTDTKPNYNTGGYFMLQQMDANSFLVAAGECYVWVKASNDQGDYSISAPAACPTPPPPPPPG